MAAKKPMFPKHVTVKNDDGTVTVHPVNPTDTKAIALALLAAAGTASAVRTVTSPTGFLVPTSVAKKAGAVTPKE